MHSSPSRRLVSLDAFRGMTIALMILVNIPGSWSYVYPPLRHAAWHGCTPTDLVFPFFLFIAGVAMAYSFAKYDYTLCVDSGMKVIERTLLIFLLGVMFNYYPFFNHALSGANEMYEVLQVFVRLLLSLLPIFLFVWVFYRYFQALSKGVRTSAPGRARRVQIMGWGLLFVLFLVGLYFVIDFIPYYNKGVAHLRIMGVLQRIALAYGCSAFLLLTVRRKYIPYVIAIILLLYWWIMWYLGGDAPYGLAMNIARRIDLYVFGETHVWQGQGIPFDPEGLLSTLPAIGTTLIGYWVGRYLKGLGQQPANGSIVLLGVGVVLILAGMVWDVYFPINKSLWTSSYVLYTGGIAIVLLSLFYWLIEVRGYKRWSRFFVVFGVNPLLAFILHVLWVKILLYIIRWEGDDGRVVNGYAWLFRNVFQPLAGDMNGSILFALTHVLLFWTVLYLLERKNIYIKI